MKKSILEQEELEKFRKKHKLQPYKIKQIYHEIFENSNIDFKDMTTLSLDLRYKLSEEFDILSIHPEKILKEEDTTKISFQTNSGETIESVIMYHHKDKKKSDIEKDWNTTLSRMTLCISSQVWCSVWCIFCVTWKMWFKENLTWKDIISQTIFSNNYVKQIFWKKHDWTYHKIRNIVFMWMWEPLLNYENTKKTAQIMMNQWFWLSLSKRHITISTCWIIPWIQKTIQDWLNCMLAISLHAPNQQLREKLVPIAKQHPIHQLINILDKYYQKTKNRIFYEYTMLKGINDEKKHAKELIKLVKKQNCHINLIAYNENPAMPQLKESDSKTIEKFKKTLEDNWLTVTLRQPFWRQSKWACGQLGWEQIWKYRD